MYIRTCRYQWGETYDCIKYLPCSVLAGVLIFPMVLDFDCRTVCRGLS